MGIHKTALVSPEACIHPEAQVGPFVVIRGGVTLEAGVVVGQFATIGAENIQVVIGEGTHIYPGAVVGERPQDVNYSGERVSVHIGKHNKIREYVTIHAGTPKGGGETWVGDHGLFMAYVHIAHDCKIGNHVVIANLTQLAGHVEMEDHVNVGGVCALSQFVRLGKYSYVAGDSTINKDVLPFSIAEGKWAVMRAVNQIAMDRGGFSKEEIGSVRRAIRMITKGEYMTIEGALEKIEAQWGDSQGVASLVKFARNSARGLAL